MTGVGIGAVHCVLPSTRTAVTDLPEWPDLSPAEKEFVVASGIGTVSVSSEAGVSELAARACRELLADHPGDPDVLMVVAPRAPDVLIGSDTGHVQSAAGLGAGFAFTVDGLGSAGSSGAWGLARDLLLADPSRHRILITFASLPAGRHRLRHPVTVTGDGAFAMTLVRGGRPRLRAHRMETDGRHHDLFHIDYRSGPVHEWRERCASPSRYTFDLAVQSRRRLMTLTEQVLSDAGVGRGAVAATVIQNLTTASYDFYRAALGLPVHPVCRATLVEHGHLGAMDVVLNLRRLLDTGDLATGDLVLVLNSNPVAWAATLWEV